MTYISSGPSITWKEVQQIKTDTGLMLPIYKDYEAIYGKILDIRMVYITTMVGKSVKGPILHRKRTAWLTAINGCVELLYNMGEGDTEIHSKLMNKDIIYSFYIEPGIAISFKNHSNETAFLLNLVSPAWTKEDPDTEKFNSWDDYFESFKK